MVSDKVKETILGYSADCGGEIDIAEYAEVLGFSRAIKFNK